jgi:TRAP-type uncharacterized transport system substrate-binding protein
MAAACPSPPATPTGVYYQLGGGYADLITKHLPQYQATAEATGTSAENIQRIARGDADIAFTLADTANDAATGNGASDSPQPIRALARIYPNYTHGPCPVEWTQGLAARLVGSLEDGFDTP